MAQTAPPGYGSNYAAILDLIRFGYAIWTPSQMAALLFHAERSTAFGREADQHSAGQAVDGIYSARQLGWVRGPAGLSAATWYRANRSLLIDQDSPRKTPDGVLRKFLRTNKFGKADPTEFVIDWVAVRRRIATWKEVASVHGSGFDSLNLRESDGEETENGLSHGERVTLSNCESHCLNLRDSPQPVEAPTPGARGDSLNLRDTVKSKSLFTEVGQSQSRAREDPSAAAVAAAVEAACGERPTDRLTSSILETARRLRLPLPVVVRWIHDKCFEVRARGYPLRAGLLAGAANTELIAWCKNNGDFVHRVQVDIERAELAAAELLQMPAAEPAAVPAEADPEFAKDLLRGIVTRKAAG